MLLPNRKYHVVDQFEKDILSITYSTSDDIRFWLKPPTKQERGKNLAIDPRIVIIEKYLLFKSKIIADDILQIEPSIIKCIEDFDDLTTNTTRIPVIIKVENRANFPITLTKNIEFISVEKLEKYDLFDEAETYYHTISIFLKINKGDILLLKNGIFTKSIILNKLKADFNVIYEIKDVESIISDLERLTEKAIFPISIEPISVEIQDVPKQIDNAPISIDIKENFKIQDDLKKKIIAKPETKPIIKNNSVFIILTTIVISSLILFFYYKKNKSYPLNPVIKNNSESKKYEPITPINYKEITKEQKTFYEDNFISSLNAVSLGGGDYEYNKKAFINLFIPNALIEGDDVDAYIKKGNFEIKNYEIKTDMVIKNDDGSLSIDISYKDIQKKIKIIDKGTDYKVQSIE